MNVSWLWNQCTRHEANLSLLAAGVLPPTARGRVEAHLARCGACRMRFHELTRVTNALKALGEALPASEPPASLRQRWQAAVCTDLSSRHSGNLTAAVTDSGWLAAWLPGGRFAWGSVGACWLLIAFFTLSAPSASKPVTAASAFSLREVVLVLKMTRPPDQTEKDDPKSSRETELAPPRLSPRSEGLPVTHSS